jgi:hypothetical protein
MVKPGVAIAGSVWILAFVPATQVRGKGEPHLFGVGTHRQKVKARCLRGSGPDISAMHFPPLPVRIKYVDGQSKQQIRVRLPACGLSTCTELSRKPYR